MDALFEEENFDLKKMMLEAVEVKDRRLIEYLSPLCNGLKDYERFGLSSMCLLSIEGAERGFIDFLLSQKFIPSELVLEYGVSVNDDEIIGRAMRSGVRDYRLAVDAAVKNGDIDRLRLFLLAGDYLEDAMTAAVKWRKQDVIDYLKRKDRNIINNTMKRICHDTSSGPDDVGFLFSIGANDPDGALRALSNRNYPRDHWSVRVKNNSYEMAQVLWDNGAKDFVKVIKDIHIFKNIRLIDFVMDRIFKNCPSESDYTELSGVVFEKPGIFRYLTCKYELVIKQAFLQDCRLNKSIWVFEPQAIFFLVRCAAKWGAWDYAVGTMNECLMYKERFRVTAESVLKTAIAQGRVDMAYKISALLRNRAESTDDNE